MASLSKINELDFVSAYYPVLCEDPKKPIKFYFTPLNVLTEEEFDSVLKVTDAVPGDGSEDMKQRFKVFRSIFVKEAIAPFKEMLLAYNTETQSKLKEFYCAELKLIRDRKYKAAKSINFITGVSMDKSSDTIMITNLSLDLLLKQIKNKTLIGKIYASQRYDKYISLLKEQYKANSEKNIPLQEGKIIHDTLFQTSITQLKTFLIPNCKAHKFGEFINTLKTSINIKEFKGSKHSDRVYELKGEAIRFFYNEKNYTKLGRDRSSVLYNSCMRHNSCYEQLKFYSNNPNSISLLVVMDKENPRQIVARTILWTTITGQKVIDRIYYNKQEDVNLLLTYCKANLYKTIHSMTASAYGLQGESDIVVHIENSEDTGLPYFDSMHCWERLNSFLSTLSKPIRDYCEKHKLNYALSNSDMMWMRGYNDYGTGFKIKGNSTYEYINDIYDNPIKEGRNVVAIDLPKEGFLNQSEVDVFGYPLRKIKRTSKQFLKELKEKYNCIATGLYRQAPDKYLEYNDDKINLVYSDVLKKFIDKRDSYFNYTLNSYIYNESENDQTIRDIYKSRRLKGIYANKVVSLSETGYNYMKQLNESLIVPLNLVKIRPSRKFHIKAKNVLKNGILLKNIIVPFKYLKSIRSNGKNKK